MHTDIVQTLEKIKIFPIEKFAGNVVLIMESHQQLLQNY